MRLKSIPCNIVTFLKEWCFKNKLDQDVRKKLYFKDSKDKMWKNLWNTYYIAIAHESNINIETTNSVSLTIYFKVTAP